MASVVKTVDKRKAQSDAKKKALVLLAKKKAEGKPENLTPLGNALRNYLSRHSASYDQVFEKQIKSLRPDWFKTDWTEAGKKAWATRQKNELAKRRSLAAKKALKTRNNNLVGNCKQFLGVYVSAFYDLKNRKPTDDELKKILVALNQYGKNVPTDSKQVRSVINAALKTSLAKTKGKKIA